MGPPAAATFQIVLILASCTSRVTHATECNQKEEFCPDGASVNLTNATWKGSGFLTESGDFFPRKTAKYRDSVLSGCICDIKPCLSFCPLRNPHESVNHKAIGNIYTLDQEGSDGKKTLRLVKDEIQFHFVKWYPCKEKGGYSLTPEEVDYDEFYILSNGLLYQPKLDGPEIQFMNYKEYCLKFGGNISTIYTPHVCFSKRGRDEFTTTRYVGGLVAVPFLIATVIVYWVLQEFRNIHGTTLRCYLCCLIVTFVFLAVDRMPSRKIYSDNVYFCLAFTIYFFLLTCFSWLNVICFDIWWTFAGRGLPQSSRSLHGGKIFLKYSIYAWGIPTVLTTICIAMEFSPNIPKLIRPGFRSKPFWFLGRTAEALYLYGPIGVTFVCNICFFILTCVQIIRRNKDTARQLNNGESQRHDDNKQWFNLYLKLFFVMGISWSTELIAWLWGSSSGMEKYFWFTTDMLNMLQGIFIFVIFVCKRNILRLLKEHYKTNKINCRLHCCIGISQSCLSSSSSRTAVTDG